MLAVLWPLMDRCTVVSKRSLQYCVPFGTAAWLWGTVYIDRGAQSAKKALNKQAEAVRDHKVRELFMLSYSRYLFTMMVGFLCLQLKFCVYRNAVVSGY